MLRTSLFSAAMVVIAAPSFAGGLAAEVVETPVVAAVVAPTTSASDWTGFYVGGQVGIVKADTQAPGEIFEAPGIVDLEIDGTFVGIHAGYMYDLGTFVLGAELDYDIIDFGDVTVSYEGDSITFDYGDGDDTVARLKLRAGYDAGRFLPYATAGIARYDSEGDNTNGSFFGAGVAFAATDNILIGGEVLQHKFDDAFDTGFDLDVTTMSLRASYKF